jgi:subtilisin family serine protease
MQGEETGLEDLYNSEIKASCAVSIMGGSDQFNGRSSAIWIVDSGVDEKHVDLNVTKNPRFAASFVAGDDNPFEDFAGHGTHCAGLAAGMGIGNPGVTGMSAGAMIIPVKVLDKDGVGSWSNLVLALDHIEKYGQPGDVVLMSLGDYGIVDCANSNQFLNQVISDLSNKGLYIVMSAGNDGGLSSQNLPGCIDGPNVFTVGSYDFTCDGFSKFSDSGNLGMPSIDWMAPGENVFSTFPGNRYAVMSGTSMSAALVAGLIHSKGGAPVAIRRESFNGITYPFAGR